MTEKSKTHFACLSARVRLCVCSSKKGDCVCVLYFITATDLKLCISAVFWYSIEHVSCVRLTVLSYADLKHKFKVQGAKDLIHSRYVQIHHCHLVPGARGILPCPASGIHLSAVHKCPD